MPTSTATVTKLPTLTLSASHIYLLLKAETSSDDSIGKALPSPERWASTQPAKKLQNAAAHFPLDGIFEPTPFREGASLQASLDSEIFELGQDKISRLISPTPSQLPDEEWYGTRKITMDSLVRDIPQNVVPEESPSFALPASLQSRKRSMSTCHSPRKRERFDLSTPIDVEDTHIKNQVSYKRIQPQFRPHQESRWDGHFKMLIKFKKKHAHCHVPHTYVDDLALSRWAKRQRHQYKLKQENKPSSMSTERQQKLEGIGFVWDPQTTVWEVRRKELEEYKNEHGNCNVPCRYKTKPQLAMWVKRQRRQYKLFKSDKLSRLSEDRFVTLTNMGFIWELRLESGITKKILQVQTANLAPRNQF